MAPIVSIPYKRAVFKQFCYAKGGETIRRSGNYESSAMYHGARSGKTAVFAHWALSSGRICRFLRKQLDRRAECWLRHPSRDSGRRRPAIRSTSVSNIVRIRLSINLFQSSKTATPVTWVARKLHLDAAISRTSSSKRSGPAHPLDDIARSHGLCGRRSIS
jgi:hypothetical protein